MARRVHAVYCRCRTCNGERAVALLKAVESERGKWQAKHPDDPNTARACELGAVKAMVDAALGYLTDAPGEVRYA